MPKEKIITGIDIGSDKISTAVATVYENKVSIIGVSGAVPSKGIKRGCVVDIDSAVESISTSLERAERMAGVSVTHAFVTVNGGHIQTQNSHGVVAVNPQVGEITREDVIRVTEAAQAITLPSSRKIIHVIPRDFIVDSQEGIKDPVGMAGVRLEVETNIIHGSATAIKNLVKCVDQVGVEVRELVFVGLASSEAVLTDTEKELGTVLVDIGGGTTSIVAFFEGSPVYSAVLGIGAKHITSDLAIGLRTRLDDAEKIKLKLGTLSDMPSRETKTIKEEMFDVSEFGLDTDEVPVKFLNEIINARLKEVFNMVAMELSKADLLGKLPAGAVITGGGGKTFGAIDIAKSTLKMPVRLGTPSGVTGLLDEIQGPSFSGTVGTVLYGVSVDRSNSILYSDRGHGNISKSISGFFEKIKSFLP
jgi:cell division protein FtsA